MATESTKKFIKNLNGTLTGEAAVTTSAGSSDADRIPALNSQGILDATIVNSTTSSSGVSDKNKLVALDSSGKISESMFPAGFVTDAISVVCSETVVAGDVVNIWNDAEQVKCRKADASGGVGKMAIGYVKEGAETGSSVIVYNEGTITGLSGLTVGRVFLSGDTAGKLTNTAPSSSGYVVQDLGYAISDTEVVFGLGTIFVV